MKYCVVIASIAFTALCGCDRSPPVEATGLDQLADLTVGSILDLPAGTVEMSHPLRLNESGVTLRGAADAITRLRFTEPCPTAGCVQIAADGLSLETLFVEILVGPAITLTDSERVRLHQLEITSTRRQSPETAMLSLTGVINSRLDNVRIDAAGGVGLWIERSQRIRVVDGDIRYGATGIALRGTTAIDLDNNHLAENGRGLLVHASPLSRALRLYRNRFIANNRVGDEDPAMVGVGLQVEAVDRLDLLNNEWQQHSRWDIKLTATSDVLMEDNVYSTLEQDYAPAAPGDLQPLVPLRLSF